MTPQLLNNKTLHTLPKSVQIPNYAIEDLKTGIVHLGLGQFARAHLAYYVETLIEKTVKLHATLPKLGIIGVNLKSPHTSEKLNSQNNLYSLRSCDKDAEQIRVIGCIKDSLYLARDYDKIIDSLITTQLITLTVTEKGYYFDPVSSELNIKHSDIDHDLTHWQQGPVKTIYGLLCRALYHAFQHNNAPPAIISCDNIRENGTLLKKLLITFMRNTNKKFADWLDISVICPNTMVDRITPPVTTTDKQYMHKKLGVIDDACVKTEAFCQWVIAKSNTRTPNFQESGAVISTQVESYETVKLSLLNGLHSGLAYLGLSCGYEFIHQAIADNNLKQFAQQYFSEVSPLMPNEIDLIAYQHAVIERFENYAVPYRCQQVANDGSQKLPQRVLSNLVRCLAQGLPCRSLIRIVASWMEFVSRRDTEGQFIAVNDPISDLLQKHSDLNHQQRIDYLLSLTMIFPQELVDNEYFRQRLQELNYAKQT